MYQDGNIYDSERDDSASSSESSLQTWINWFCSLAGHEFYIEVPEVFIDDEFNLTGLSSIVPYYTQALETILDMESGEFFDDDEEEEEDEDEFDLSLIENYYNSGSDFWSSNKTPKRGVKKLIDSRIVEPYAFMLYGLIHQRYLTTRDGLRLMATRYNHHEFGVCPRYYCNESPVLPIGRYDETGKESIHLYCPKCVDIYNPPNTTYQCVDGAHFGSTYPNLLFLTYPELNPGLTSRIYQPSIFGFKVSSISRSGPQNQWLRKYLIGGRNELIDTTTTATDQKYTSNTNNDSLTQQINKLHIYNNKTDLLQ